MNDNLDVYVYTIVALLPIVGCLVIFQANPYHALAMRGILGAIAALVYVVLGAADVALTEALMGTLLAITLYAVAVRSSMVLRLGILEDSSQPLAQESDFVELMVEFRKILDKRYMRLELVTYSDKQALQRGISEKEIHAACSRSSSINIGKGYEQYHRQQDSPYHTEIRIQRIYEIMQAELLSPLTGLSFVSAPDIVVQTLEEKHL